MIDPDIPIVKLSEGQELELIASAKLGLGIKHTKFSPGLVYYASVPIAEKAGKEGLKGKQVIEVSEKEFEEIKQGKGKKIYDLVGSIVKSGEDYIHIKPGEEMVFFIESWGQIKAKEILEGSVKALKENLKSVK